MNLNPYITMNSLEIIYSEILEILILNIIAMAILVKVLYPYKNKKIYKTIMN